MSKKPKYPWSLFFIGFIMNLIKYFYLLLPGIVLLFIGIWSKGALIIGVCLLALDIIISLIEQIQIRHTTLHSDDPNFKPFQDAMLSDNWIGNMHDLLEGKMSGEADFVNLDNVALLQKCTETLNLLSEELLEFYREKSSVYLNEIMLENSSSVEAYIDDIVKIVLPDLEYIKESLEKEFIINKRKIKYPELIQSKWSDKSQLYVDLMDLYNGISD